MANHPEYSINVFHILADASHTVSKLLLIWAIHSNRSAEGVSLITQVLYAVVFCTRYLDIFNPKFQRWLDTWNFTLKIFYITSSLYIIFVMMRLFARTREREKAWKLGAFCLGGAMILMMPVTGIFKPFTFMENLWVFSEILESVAVLPQLLLLRQTTVPTVIDSYYLVALGSYRALYIINWIWRGAKGDKPDAVSVIFGIIQTALYLDFAWVYWSRQRVKLRGGAVIDGDDLRNGWLVKRFLGNQRKTAIPEDDDLDEEAGLGDEDDGIGHANGNGNGRTRSHGWGKRGISVSADDGIHDIHRDTDEDARPLADPASFDDESEEEVDATPKGVGNGDEWREGAGRR